MPEESKTVAKPKQETSTNAIDNELRTKMENLSDSLIEQRKLMKAPDNYPKKEDLSQYKETGTFNLHKDGGVLSMDVFHDEFVLSGGKNGEAVMFDVNSSDVVSRFVPYYGNEIGLVKFAPTFSVD